jgi:NAD(P)-dependent dehydrogenase (short-subunit alcohol dehydrogenase family)
MRNSREEAMDASALDLKGQVALVTGAARGIGRAAAEALAACGARVAIADVLADEAEQTAAELQAGGREALALAVDVREESQLRAAVARTIAQLGGLDVLVNNAGGTFVAPYLQVNRRGFDMLINLNLTSVWVATQAAAAHWIAQRIPGRVINVSSTEGLKACPGYAAYSAAKAGVISLTKTLAAELGPYGIRVNCIAPDYTETRGVSELRSGAESMRSAAGRIPLGRLGQPDDHAGAILFFASELSRWITGQTLIVDGGAWWAARAEGAFPVMPQDQKTR